MWHTKSQGHRQDVSVFARAGDSCAACSACISADLPPSGLCRAALPPLPPPAGAGTAGSRKQQRPLPITLVVASVDGSGLFHDSIVVTINFLRRHTQCCAVCWPFAVHSSPCGLDLAVL